MPADLRPPGRTPRPPSSSSAGTAPAPAWYRGCSGTPGSTWGTWSLPGPTTPGASSSRSRCWRPTKPCWPPRSATGPARPTASIPTPATSTRSPPWSADCCRRAALGGEGPPPPLPAPRLAGDPPGDAPGRGPAPPRRRRRLPAARNGFAPQAARALAEAHLARLAALQGALGFPDPRLRRPPRRPAGRDAGRGRGHGPAWDEAAAGDLFDPGLRHQKARGSGGPDHEALAAAASAAGRRGGPTRHGKWPPPSPPCPTGRRRPCPWCWGRPSRRAATPSGPSGRARGRARPGARRGAGGRRRDPLLHGVDRVEADFAWCDGSGAIHDADLSARYTHALLTGAAETRGPRRPHRPLLLARGGHRLRRRGRPRRSPGGGDDSAPGAALGPAQCHHLTAWPPPPPPRRRDRAGRPRRRLAGGRNRPQSRWPQPGAPGEGRRPPGRRRG